MRTSFIYTVVFFLILVFVSCGKKEDPESYEVRKREHRLFRCKVDGKEWTYTGKEYWGLVPHIRSGYYTEDSLLIIKAKHYTDEEKTVSITLYSGHGLKLGNNKLNKDTEIWGMISRGDNREIEKDSDQNNLYIQDIDTINHIIKGTFQFITEPFRGNPTIVSEGEFDLKISTWIKKY